MELFKEDEYDTIEISKENRTSNFQQFETSNQFFGDNISEEEFVFFDSLRNNLLNSNDPSVTNQICHEMTKAIDQNVYLSHLLNTYEFCNFLMSFSISMHDDPIILASSLSLISDVLVHNSKAEIIQYFTNIDFVDILFFAISECSEYIYLLIPAYECLSMMIEADSSLIIPFVEKNGLEMMLNSLTQPHNDEIEESIGIIAYQFFIAIDEGIKEENGDITQKLELSDEHMDCLRDIFCFLLGGHILNPVFGIMHHIITYHEDIFQQLLEGGICSDIFNLSLPIQSLLQKVIDFHINKEKTIVDEPPDISRKKKTILNAIIVFDEMTQKIEDLNEISANFPLQHIIDIFLKCAEFSSLTSFDSICQELIDCLCTYIDKSEDFAVSLFRTKFKSKVIRHWESLNFSIKKSFIHLLLKLFANLPKSIITEEFDDYFWEMIIDFIDSDDKDTIILLATAIKHMVDCDYSVVHFAPFIEQLQAIELDITPDDYKIQYSQHSEEEENQNLDEERCDCPNQNPNEFFDILISMIEDELNEEEEIM